MNSGLDWSRERHAFELLQAMRSLLITVEWFQHQLPDDFGNIDRIRLHRAWAAATAYEAAIARDAPHPVPAGWQVTEPGHQPMIFRDPKIATPRAHALNAEMVPLFVGVEL